MGRPRVWGGGRGRALKLVAEGNDNGDLLGRIILPLSFLSELFLKAEKMTDYESFSEDGDFSKYCCCLIFSFWPL